MLCFLACVGDSNGCQLIHEAAQHDQLHCLKFLLKASVKASATDAKGRNILHKVWFQYKGRASLHVCVHVCVCTFACVNKMVVKNYPSV